MPPFGAGFTLVVECLSFENWSRGCCIRRRMRYVSCSPAYTHTPLDRFSLGCAATSMVPIPNDTFSDRSRHDLSDAALCETDTLVAVENHLRFEKLLRELWVYLHCIEYRMHALAHVLRAIERKQALHKMCKSFFVDVCVYVSLAMVMDLVKNRYVYGSCSPPPPSLSRTEACVVASVFRIFTQPS